MGRAGLGQHLGLADLPVRLSCTADDGASTPPGLDSKTRNSAGDLIGQSARVSLAKVEVGKLSQHTEHRTSKYLNNIIEADHGGLQRMIRPTRGSR